jgi:hypothetical protein
MEVPEQSRAMVYGGLGHREFRNPLGRGKNGDGAIGRRSRHPSPNRRMHYPSDRCMLVTMAPLHGESWRATCPTNRRSGISARAVGWRDKFGPSLRSRNWSTFCIDIGALMGALDRHNPIGDAATRPSTTDPRTDQCQAAVLAGRRFRMTTWNEYGVTSVTGLRTGCVGRQSQ